MNDNVEKSIEEFIQMLDKLQIPPEKRVIPLGGVPYFLNTEDEIKAARAALAVELMGTSL